MVRRQLDVTADTTLGHVEARASGPDWSTDALGVVDVESPGGDEPIVRLGVELDPGSADALDPHVDYALLSPSEARRLAADLEAMADAAEAGERATSGRG